MFKLVVLSALLAVAVARPSHLGLESAVVLETPIVREHSFEKVGAIVKTLPSAVSHQSSTIVHNLDHVVKPIVAPVVKTYAGAPIVKVANTPLVQTYAANPWTIAAPSQLTYSGVAPYTYSAPYSYSAPLKYAVGW